MPKADAYAVLVNPVSIKSYQNYEGGEMTEENEEKKSWFVSTIKWIADKTLVTMNNEANLLKGADNVRDINITVNIDAVTVAGDTTYTETVPVSKPRDVGEYLEKNPPKSPIVGKLILDTPEKVEWFEANFSSTATASAATITSVATSENIGISEDILVKLSGDDEDE